MPAEPFSTSSGQLFLEFSSKKLRQPLSRIHVSLKLLDGDRLWLRAGDSSNSIADLCLHLSEELQMHLIERSRCSL